MSHYVIQYGKSFFELVTVNGFDHRFFKGTKVSDKEYTKLFYSGERTIVNNLLSGCRISRYRIKGNAKDVIGRDVEDIAVN